MAITKMRFSRDFEENVEPVSSQPDPTSFAAATARASPARKRSFYLATCGKPDFRPCPNEPQAIGA
jgi:hypothetical protein